jgi:hypothetical protein
MVVRRKYRSRADQAPAVADVPVAAAQAPPVAPGPSSVGNGGSPLQAALEAQQHAEALQHQHAHRQNIGLPEPPINPQERQAIDQYVDAIPNLTPHQQRFLKAHPSLLREPYMHLMAHAIMVARHAGIADDTPQMDAAILSGVARDIEHHHHLKQLTSASARPTAANAATHADIDQHAAELQQEAAQHLAEYQPAPVAPPPPPKRSFPMQAPVSRDLPSITGQPHESKTLNAAEREIAHNSFTDPHMTKAQKEYLYLRNRQKLQRMRADGSYSEQRDG